MIAYRFARYSLGIVALAAMSAGCGPEIRSPAVSSPFATNQAAHVRGALLYVLHTVGMGSHASSDVSMLTYPRGKTVATLQLQEYATGICSDSAGNVWMPLVRHMRWYVDEFAHGGTKAIAELRMPKGTYTAGCALDPSSGSLAVMGGMGSNEYHGCIFVWSGSHEGKPTVYAAPFFPLHGTYDNAGDLFIDGWPGDSDFFLVFGGLLKGSGSVVKIALDRRTWTPGDVQWDGTYVAVATGGYRVRYPRIYRVQVTSSGGKVVGTVHPRNLYRDPEFTLFGSDVIGMAGGRGDNIDIWPYPDGGKPTRVIADFDSVTGLTISR
jgi:hypothetical protein